MRRRALVLAVLVALAGSASAEAATLSITLNVDSFRDIDVPTPDFPGEFKGQQSVWGRVTFLGSLVGYYLFSTREMMHNGNLTPTIYPNPWYTIVIRTIGGSEVLILQGISRPAVDGGGVVGGVIVATPGVAFLRNATFTLSAGTITFTY